MESVLSLDQIAAWKPYSLPHPGHDALLHTRARMAAAGQWAPWQMVGRRMTIGCVALEITQRCNLDCTYCYLSENSEALTDIPLEEVFRRIDLIHAHYGNHTDVQVTGGDPTLRRRDELVAIVRRIREKKMRPTLFTNGIKASRELLAELAGAGLEDVAFHVDLTQERKGYATERDLNALRAEYIERVRGLNLAVIFNTTVFPGNFKQIADVVRFFVDRSDAVRFASFQIGAGTGRGTLRERAAPSPAAVMQAIREATGANLRFDAASAGHADCNGYAYALVVGGRVFDFFDDPAFVQEVIAASAGLTVERANRMALGRALAGFLLRHPKLLAGFLRRAAGFIAREWRTLAAARGRVRKISFFVHNFMDADALETARCESCAFMVMTPDGPMSMCVHNAKRDDYLLVPAKVTVGQVVRFFNPATGQMDNTPPTRLQPLLTRKNTRGRAKMPLPLAAE